MGDGAFSNVYKAIERKTGRKVAVKVVRKYELNSSQVRLVFMLVLFSYHILCPFVVSRALARPGSRRHGLSYYITSLYFLGFAPVRSSD